MRCIFCFIVAYSMVFAQSTTPVIKSTTTSSLYNTSTLQPATIDISVPNATKRLNTSSSTQPNSISILNTTDHLKHEDNTTVPTTEVKGTVNKPLRVVCPVDTNTTNITWHKQSGDSYSPYNTESKSSNEIVLDKLTHEHGGVYRCSTSPKNATTDVIADSGEVIAFIKLTVISATKGPPLISRKRKLTTSNPSKSLFVDR